MRIAPIAGVLATASLVVVVVLGLAWAQRAPTTGLAPQPTAAPSEPTTVTAPPPAMAPQAFPAPPAPQSAPAPTQTVVPKCTNPNALGVARTVEIDTSGGPGFGFEHFKQHNFLRQNEVVLTFDDGPWPTTPAVVQALADQCVRATFFPIGKHATYYPEILKSVADGGHTIGSHTWGHQDLSRKTVQEAKDEVEKGFSAVRFALGVPGAPFFRFPALRHPPEMVTYLGQRNVGIFSTDFDSFDFKMRKPEQVVASILAKLEKHGKGIVLMHDFQQATSLALPELLIQLKAKGYKVVHMKAKDQVTTLPEYDELLLKDVKLPTVSTRPTSSVVRTVE